MLLAAGLYNKLKETAFTRPVKLKFEEFRGPESRQTLNPKPFVKSPFLGLWSLNTMCFGPFDSPKRVPSFGSPTPSTLHETQTPQPYTSPHSPLIPLIQPFRSMMPLTKTQTYFCNPFLIIIREVRRFQNEGRLFGGPEYWEVYIGVPLFMEIATLSASCLNLDIYIDPMINPSFEAAAIMFIILCKGGGTTMPLKRCGRSVL